ncbi:histidine phosphatase family protein [cf. Phormidesmis sp. LEGE 11477]|uniref:histidine phosphatase family protein n=1 Tax=cf. Phormidesmis sp. LEGE 11477 TaxID=1828680 RepID=UPI00187F3A38|nr:histidine phosphatase family protein [cf. Phormidesmis sp. LEGE 11477]MBE9064432.1 histidine phosphatase family protein [cf. Phormidesmis sp. LEGE 11477]
MTYLKLILIRHAESIGNTRKVMEGQSSTPLSDKGIFQAQQLSAALVAQPTPESLSTIYSSPLLRATQTADILTASSGQNTYRLSDHLQEIHQGVFQGLTWLEAQAQHPQLCRQLLGARQWQPVPKAESPDTARNRAVAWVNQVLCQHQPGESVWAISHAGIMQQLVAVILGCDRTWKISIHHTARFEFWLSQTHWQTLGTDRFNPEYWIVRRFNDYAHLTS